MQTVSQLLGGQAAPRFVEHNGKRYQARALTQAVKSEIERALETAVRRAILGPPGETPPEVAAAALRQHARDVAAGRFSFFGPECVAWMQTFEGVQAIGQALFGVGGDELLSLLTEKADEAAHVVAVTIREALPPAVLRALEKAEAEAEAKAKAEAEAKAKADDDGAERFDPNV